MCGSISRESEKYDLENRKNAISTHLPSRLEEIDKDRDENGEPLRETGEKMLKTLWYLNIKHIT